MILTLVLAMSANRVIGRDGDLPWRLPEDLKHFKRVTMGKPVVMGRKTWDSLGKPLPGRQNIVITRQKDFVADGCDVVACPGDALRVAAGADEVMVIGGGEIYRAFLRVADRVYLTRVHADVDGDARFPELPANTWQRTSSEVHEADDANEHPFTFEIYERKDHS